MLFIEKTVNICGKNVMGSCGPVHAWRETERSQRQRQSEAEQERDRTGWQLMQDVGDLGCEMGG